MSEERFNVPVLLVVFNRPKATKVTLDAIRQVKPTKLYVAADGPRKNKAGEAEVCKEVRDLVLNGVDWDCEVKTLFREENVGCGRGVSEAVTWLFDNEETGIIIEDDCVATKSFFYFCRDLLDYYKDNEKIMHIGGNNFQNGKKRGNASYYFSAYSHNWGWATWRNRWKKFDFNLDHLEDFEQSNRIYNISNRDEVRTFWIYQLQTNKKENKKVDIWDQQWLFSIWNANGVAVIPNENLVTNIGDGSDATHSFDKSSHLINIPAYEIKFPLKHPKSLDINREADDFSFGIIWGGTLKRRYPLPVRAARLIYRKLKDKLYK